MRTLTILSLSTALLTGCSLTTAGGLSECETTADCDANQVCTDNFCLPQPAGCGEFFGETAADAVQMGAVLPLSLSATDPTQGQDASEVQGLNAIKLALKEINDPGRGVAGKRIALHVCDTAGDVARTSAQTEWLVNEKKVVAMLTAGSSQTLAATALTLPNGVLTMSSSATSPELTTREDRQNLLWRTAPSDAIQGKVIANLLLNDPEFSTVQRVGILYLDDAYGQGLFNVITEQLTGRRQFEGAQYARKLETGPDVALTKVDAFNPDVTVIVGFEDDVKKFIKRAGTSSTNMKASVGHRWFFSDSAKDPALLSDTEVRAQVQGAYGTAPAQGAGQAYASFRSRFITENPNTDPGNFSFTSHSYDSMYLLGLGVAYSQGTSNAVTGVKMAEGLTKVSSGQTIQMTSSNLTLAASELAAGRSIDAEGASGSLQFDAAGEAPSPIELWQVEGTGFKSVRNVPPPP